MGFTQMFDADILAKVGTGCLFVRAPSGSTKKQPLASKRSSKKTNRGTAVRRPPQKVSYLAALFGRLFLS